MTRFTFEGQGRTVGGGSGVLLVICVLLLAGSGGAVAAVSAAVIDALLAAAAVTVLTVAATVAFVVHRARNPSPEGVVRLPLVRSTVRYELPDPQRAAIGEAAPRELHQHVHYHYHGAEQPREEILRRQSERPEQGKETIMGKNSNDQAKEDQKAAAERERQREEERKARNAAIAELTQRSMWGPRNGGKGPSR